MVEIDKKEEDIYECFACGKPVPDYEPKMCCSGYMCGCRGQPTEPPVCSSDCWDRILEWSDK